jgi:hypothetical protein
VPSPAGRLAVDRHIGRSTPRFVQPPAHSPSRFPLPTLGRLYSVLARRGVAFGENADMANDLMRLSFGQSCHEDTRSGPMVASFALFEPALSHMPWLWSSPVGSRLVPRRPSFPIPGALASR